MSVVKISSLSCSYNGDSVLEDISFDVRKKDFVAIIGPNGSGKTTLINAMLGKLKPAGGSITLFGKKQEDFTEWERIGYVPQRFSVDRLFPGTVRELLSLGKSNKPASALGMRQLLHKKILRTLRWPAAESPHCLCAAERPGTAHSGRAHGWH